MRGSRRLFLAILLAGSGPAAAEHPGRDPVALYPDNYRVLLENERVRVLDFRLARGASEEFHDHPANVAVFLGQFTIHFRFPDGTTAVREGRPGVAAYSEATTHASRNVGETDAHGVLVELKAPAAGTITAVTLIHGLPGRSEELKQHLLSLAPATRAEPGCLRYDLYQSPEQPHEFMRLEEWTNAEALEAHKRMPHLRASFEKRQREGWTTQILTWSRVAEDLP